MAGECAEMKPLFSIIIPVYNVAPYLCECLDSVLGQTVDDWECICVDDGATDGSGDILDSYSAKDGRFKVVHKCNEGVSVARNIGIEKASGDYFLFVDADDVITPWALGMFAKNLQGGEVDGIVSNVGWHRFCNRVELDSLLSKFGDRFLRGDYKYAISKNRFDLLCGIDAAVGCVCGRIFSARKFRDLRFPRDVRIMEDIRFWAAAISREGLWGEINIPFYFYRMRPGSASNAVDMGGRIDVFNGHAYVVARLKESGSITRMQWFGYWYHYAPYLYYVWRKVSCNWRILSSSLKQQIMSSMRYFRDESYLRLPLSFYLIDCLGDDYAAGRIMSALHIFEDIYYRNKWRLYKCMRIMHLL